MTDLGPVLATISVGMDSIPYLADKPDMLHEVSQGLKAQALSALDDIRRIAYNLRPPALDELGLLPAIQQFINANTHPNGLQILFEAPDQLARTASSGGSCGLSDCVGSGQQRDSTCQRTAVSCASFIRVIFLC